MSKEDYRVGWVNGRQDARGSKSYARREVAKHRALAKGEYAGGLMPMARAYALGYARGARSVL